MSNGLSTENLRLKFGSKFVVAKITFKDGVFLDLEVNAPSSGLEKDSFYRISKEISKLVYSGVKSRGSISGTIKRMVNVDPKVLKFMVKLVDERLPLEG